MYDMKRMLRRRDDWEAVANALMSVMYALSGGQAPDVHVDHIAVHFVTV